MARARAGQQPDKESEKDDDDDEAEGGDEGEESEEGEEEEGEAGEEDESEGEEEDGDESEGEELSIDQDTGRIIVGGTVNYATRVFDDALRMSDAARLVADCTTVFTAREAGEEGEYSAGSTFFVPADAAPKTALELLALQIFRYHARDAAFDPARSGAEWWTQVIETEADIAWHWDRDYDLQDGQGIQIHPHLATVTYVNVGGAPTVVLERASPLLAADSLEGEVAACTACAPRVGRHLSFDGRMLHGAPSSVLDAAPPAPPAAVKPASKLASKRAKPAVSKPAVSKPAVPVRVTFLVNLWLNHTPGGAAPLPTAVGAKLQPAASSEAPEIAFSPEREVSVLELPAAAPAKPLRWSFGDPARRHQPTCTRTAHALHMHVHTHFAHALHTPCACHTCTRPHESICRDQHMHMHMSAHAHACTCTARTCACSYSLWHLWLQARRLRLELPWPEALRFPQAQARIAAPLDLCIDAFRRRIAARIPACLPARVHTLRLRTYPPTHLRVLFMHA